MGRRHRIDRPPGMEVPAFRPDESVRGFVPVGLGSVVRGGGGRGSAPGLRAHARARVGPGRARGALGHGVVAGGCRRGRPACPAPARREPLRRLWRRGGLAVGLSRGRRRRGGRMGIARCVGVGVRDGRRHRLGRLDDPDGDGRLRGWNVHPAPVPPRADARLAPCGTGPGRDDERGARPCPILGRALVQGHGGGVVRFRGADVPRRDDPPVAVGPASRRGPGRGLAHPVGPGGGRLLAAVRGVGGGEPPRVPARECPDGIAGGSRPPRRGGAKGCRRRSPRASDRDAHAGRARVCRGACRSHDPRPRGLAMAWGGDGAGARLGRRGHERPDGGAGHRGLASARRRRLVPCPRRGGPARFRDRRRAHSRVLLGVPARGANGTAVAPPGVGAHPHRGPAPRAHRARARPCGRADALVCVGGGRRGGRDGDDAGRFAQGARRGALGGRPLRVLGDRGARLGRRAPHGHAARGGPRAARLLARAPAPGPRVALV